MNVLLDNPVLRRELTKHLRLRSGRLATKIVIAALVLIILRYYVLLLVRTENGATADANDAFGFCVYGVLVATALLSPSLSAMSISRERETQTWEQLSLTRLTPHQVLLGKWLGRQAEVGILTIVLVPMVLVAALRSAMDPVGSLYVLAFLALNSAFFTMIGVVCSMAARRTPTATGAALIVSAVLCVGTYIIKALADSWLHSDFSPYILILNPFEVLARLLSITRSQSYFGDTGPIDPQTFVLASVSIEILAIVLGYAWMKRRYCRLQ